MSQPDGATAAACRVAVVDDDDAVRRALGRLLRVTGHQVRTYASAEEFLGAAPNEVDCLVLDIYLGGMTGYDLHSLLMAEGQAPPTVFVTAHDDVMLGTSLRADGECLRKPFDDDHLLGAIARACTKV
ncbi:MAG: response regulator transcription factor [Gemmatimonadales bacterium]|jgi:FixJ family two-component response regulator